MAELIDQHWSHGPHYQFSDSIIFLTWRLAFTLPKHLIALFEELKAETITDNNMQDLESQKNRNAYLFQRFQEYDLALAKFQNPGFSLNEPVLAKIVTEAFHHLDGKKYELHAYCVMSNHVHILIKALTDEAGKYYYVSNIVQSLKRYTANHINIALGKKGQIWDDFYFDRIIRNMSNYENVVNYILSNPFSAGLVEDMDKWRDSFFNPGYLMG
ncbi:MAG: transposase [Candidatus Cloacimonadaceae bacterium]|nr:transposase [Candidatus Cloacimonadaceae bacterium]MDP3113726.1 transposase [Candidatus Cloacimonadaceae bacterium]